MTKHENRVLYLLHKHGGRAQHSVISQGMARVDAADRQRALAAVEDLGLVKSAATPNGPKGGSPARHYWLTDAGREHVVHAIASGELKDPALERRGQVHKESPA